MDDLGVVNLVLETDPSGKGDAENEIEESLVRDSEDDEDRRER